MAGSGRGSGRRRPAGQRVRVDFCYLVTQRRPQAELDVVADGPDAERWLGIAQAFAGPPARAAAIGPADSARPSRRYRPASGPTARRRRCRRNRRWTGRGRQRPVSQTVPVDVQQPFRLPVSVDVGMRIGCLDAVQAQPPQRDLTYRPLTSRPTCRR